MADAVRGLQKQGRSARILLVEDNPADVEMVRRFLKKSKIGNDLYVVTSGDQAMDFLNQEGAYSDDDAVPSPDLILLDLNLPGMDGREVLKEVKSDQNLKKIPVVVLTTSDFGDDINNAYEQGANSYIVKPITRDQFFQVIDTFESYWFQVVVLPDESDGDRS